MGGGSTASSGRDTEAVGVAVVIAEARGAAVMVQEGRPYGGVVAPEAVERLRPGQRHRLG